MSTGYGPASPPCQQVSSWKHLWKHWIPRAPPDFPQPGPLWVSVAMAAEWLREGQLLCWTSSSEDSQSRLLLQKEVAIWPPVTSLSSRKPWGTWLKLALPRSGLDHMRPEEGRWSLEDGMGPASIG